MEQPTKKEITKKVQLALEGKLAREDVYEWAWNYIKNDDCIDVKDLDAWHYLVAISDIDETVEPGKYLFSEEDICNIMNEYI